MVRQEGSNGTPPECSRHREISGDEMATHIRRIRDSCPPLFSDELYGLNAQEWTYVMAQNFRALRIPKAVRVTIACMFLRGIPAQWFEEVAEPSMYRWNKFRISLETTFMGSVGCWQSRMVTEYGNSTTDNSDGGYRLDDEQNSANASRSYGEQVRVGEAECAVAVYQEQDNGLGDHNHHNQGHLNHDDDEDEETESEEDPEEDSQEDP